MKPHLLLLRGARRQGTGVAVRRRPVRARLARTHDFARLLLHEALRLQGRRATYRVVHHSSGADHGGRIVYDGSTNDGRAGILLG